MEQKKILWIIAAVGIFLCVVFGAALILSNTNSSTGTYAKIPSTQSLRDDGWTPEETPSTNPDDINIITQENNQSDLVPTSVENMYVLSNNTTIADTEGTTIDLNALKNSLISADEKQKENDAEEIASVVRTLTNNKVESNVNSNSVSDAKEYYVGKSAAEAEKAEKTNSVRKTNNYTPTANVKDTKVAAKTSTPVKNVTAKPATHTTKTNTHVAPEAKKTTRYWVQVASYSNKKTAENAREVLDENKIGSDIFTYQDNKNNLFYRVRVGPYTTKSEAEYWMSKISQVKTFNNAGSYVTCTTN